MQLNPYVNFNGQCEAAFKFYEKVLGGKITFSMTWGEMPGADQFPAESHKLIMHSTLSLGDKLLMGADAPPGRYQEPKGMNLSLHFKALAEGGSVTMPFEKTFWSPGFGMCVDKFGIPWMINTEGTT